MGDIVYKVAYRDIEGNIVSRIAELAAEVIYKVDKFVSAPEWLAEMGYHLLVFESKKRAEKWHCSRFAEIWEAEAEDEVPLPDKLHLGYLLTYSKTEFSGADWPGGTRMYKRVKLLRRVN
jgi:hypothetical protein